VGLINDPHDNGWADESSSSSPSSFNFIAHIVYHFPMYTHLHVRTQGHHPHQSMWCHFCDPSFCCSLVSLGPVSTGPHRSTCHQSRDLPLLPQKIPLERLV